MKLTDRERAYYLGKLQQMRAAGSAEAPAQS